LTLKFEHDHARFDMFCALNSGSFGSEDAAIAFLSGTTRTALSANAHAVLDKLCAHQAVISRMEDDEIECNKG